MMMDLLQVESQMFDSKHDLIGHRRIVTVRLSVDGGGKACCSQFLETVFFKRCHIGVRL